MHKLLLVGVVALSLMLSSMSGFAAVKHATSCRTRAKEKCVTTARHGKKSLRLATKCVTKARTRSAAKCATKSKRVARKAHAHA